MITSQIHLNLDLGDNQQLLVDLEQAWDRLMDAEPECRDVALLMFVRRALAPDKIIVEISPQDHPCIHPLARVPTFRCSVFERDGVKYCDLCSQRWPPLE